MCLLKPTDQSITCTHDECKNFKFLNRPGCVYSFGQAPPSESISNNPSIQGSNPTKKPLYDFLAMQKQPHSSNNSSRATDESADDDFTFSLNKKKVKTESSTMNPIVDMTPPTLSNVLPLNLNCQQLLANTPSCNKQPINPSMLANLGNNLQVYNTSQPLIAAFSQNYQPNMELNGQNLQFMPMQGGFMNPLQQLSQNMSIANNNELNTRKEDPGLKRLEEMMKEMQSRLVGTLVSQNKMLIDLKDKNDLIQDTLACLITELNSLKQSLKPAAPEQTQSAAPTQHMKESFRETPTSESLMTNLYGPNPEFPYQLMFKNDFVLPLYRERNFKFTILLADKNGNLVQNNEKITLSLAIYNSEHSPKLVDVNNSGNKIFKGIIDKEMVNGAVTFDKIQIKEVTSHFRNGWVFFMVFPKAGGNTRGINGAARSNITAPQIKPLIVERVVVKAKRAKLNLQAQDDNDDSKSPESPEEDIFN